MAAISLLGLFGAALLSMDYGNTVSTRRNLVTGTDSTALDQAKHLAFASSGTCQLTWTDYLIRNVGGAGTTPLTCTPSFGTGTQTGMGWVGVDARKSAETRFGGLFGLGNTNPYSFSAAQWGFITQAEGLRPMGICLENEHIQEWIAYQNGGMTETQYNALPVTDLLAHPIYPGAGVTHRILFTKDNPDDCGTDAPGNWGWMDFECNNDADTPAEICGNSNAELVQLIQYGYQELAGLGDCDGDAGTPGGETGDYCNGDTGSSGGSVGSALNSLISNQIEFLIPIFDSVTVDSGNNVYFNMVYFVAVRLLGFRMTGPESGRYFDFEFVELVASGNCCSPAPAVDTGIRGVRLCAVDHDTQPGATDAGRCTATT